MFETSFSVWISECLPDLLTKKTALTDELRPGSYSWTSSCQSCAFLLLDIGVKGIQTFAQSHWTTLVRLFQTSEPPHYRADIIAVGGT